MDMETLKEAVVILHEQYRIPHIVVTSISLPALGAAPSLGGWINLHLNCGAQNIRDQDPIDRLLLQWYGGYVCCVDAGAVAGSGI